MASASGQWGQWQTICYLHPIAAVAQGKDTQALMQALKLNPPSTLGPENSSWLTAIKDDKQMSSSISEYWYKVGLTRESLFEFLARSETRFLDPKFSRDSRETRESKLVVRLASRESHRQKFRSETREKWVSLWNFVARIASYESPSKKFRSKTSFSRVSQTNVVARLASLANKIS
jgi:hypothetical protein